MNRILKFFKHLNKNQVLIGIAVIAVIITAALILSNSGGGFSLSGIFGNSDKKIAENVIKYINDNQLSVTPASLVKFSSESGLVKITIKIGNSEFDSYATKDGKLLFPQAFNMIPEKGGDKNSSANTTPTEVIKSDSPVLDVFIVSRCPYGLQIQRAVVDAVKNAPDLAKYVKVRYIGEVSGNTITAMHGEAEAKENLRQICIREEQADKYWNYSACQMKKGDTAGCEASTGVNSANLNACIADVNRGVAYAKKDFDLSAQYGASGSPTLVLNGTTISESSYGGRSSDGIKSMVCAGFNTQAGFCSKKLNTVQAAVSFSETYEDKSGSSSSNSNAGCEPAQ